MNSSSLLYIVLGFLLAVTLVGVIVVCLLVSHLKKVKGAKQTHGGTTTSSSIASRARSRSRERVVEKPRYESKRHKTSRTKQVNEARWEDKAKKNATDTVIGATNTQVSDFYDEPEKSAADTELAESIGLKPIESDDEEAMQGALTKQDIRNLKHPIKRGLPYDQLENHLDSLAKLFGVGKETYLKNLYKESESVVKAFFKENVPVSRDDSKIDENIRAQLKEFNVG